MIKANHHALNLTYLLVSGFILLFAPLWVTSTLALTAVLGLLVYWAHQHPQAVRLAWQFCIEFLGFCLLVGLFVSMLAFYSSYIG